MTDTRKPDAAELSDADLDTAAGGGKKSDWIEISSVHQGINRATGEVPIEDITFKFEPPK